MIGFCVVDDHEVVHDGLGALAGREPDLEFLGAASTVADGEMLVERARPAVVLVDLRIGEHGGESGIDLCRTLTRRTPPRRTPTRRTPPRRTPPRRTPPAVVIYSAYGNRELLTQAIEAGASGYVLKETSVRRMPAILREVTGSGSWFEPRIAGDLLQRRLGTPGAASAFGERDLVIVRAVSRGENNHQIGERLHVSPHTVKYHIAGMLRRHGCTRRAELVSLAYDLHLLDGG